MGNVKSAVEVVVRMEAGDVAAEKSSAVWQDSYSEIEIRLAYVHAQAAAEAAVADNKDYSVVEDDTAGADAEEAAHGTSDTYPLAHADYTH